MTHKSAKQNQLDNEGYTITIHDDTLQNIAIEVGANTAAEIRKTRISNKSAYDNYSMHKNHVARRSFK
jgi:hypothetical protein